MQKNEKKTEKENYNKNNFLKIDRYNFELIKIRLYSLQTKDYKVYSILDKINSEKEKKFLECEKTLLLSVLYTPNFKSLQKKLLSL